METQFRAYHKIKQEIVEITQLNFINEIAFFKNGLGQTEVLFKNMILMQSTGLLDKEGKEIFEGDIIECEYLGVENIKQYQDIIFKGEIIFNNGAFYIKKGSYENITHILLSNNKIKIEIIGNIYQDKNLIN